MEIAIIKEYEIFNKEDFSDILRATISSPIHGLNDRGRVTGRIYQTKEKYVVAVFVGILSKDPPLFGRVVMSSHGKEGSTVKMECDKDTLSSALLTIRMMMDTEGVPDQDAYVETFLRNVMSEMNFDQGIFIPDLDGKNIQLLPDTGNKRKDGPKDDDSDDSKVKSEGPEEEEETECMICLDARPDTLVIPCMHKVVCKECSHGLQNTADKRTCVRCRNPIEGISFETGEFESFQ